MSDEKQDFPFISTRIIKRITDSRGSLTETEKRALKEGNDLAKRELAHELLTKIGENE